MINDESLVLAPPEGTAAGGGCYICKLVPVGRFVRTFQIIDFEGELVFCEGCVKDMAHLIGFYSAEARKNLLKQIGDYKKKTESLKAKSEAYDLFMTRVEAAS